MAGTTAAIAKMAGRRLKSVSGHVSGSTLVVVLPDDSQVTRSAIMGSPSSTRLELNGKPILQYSINLEQEYALDLSAFGTPFEGKTKHVPRYPLVQLSPCDSGPATCPIPDFWAALHALFTLYHEQEQIPTLLSSSLQNAPELAEYILYSGLGRLYPSHTPRNQSSCDPTKEILFISRSGFWQGAGTQGYHTRSWLRNPRPVFPMISSFTRAENVVAKHPLRPAKPRPGEVLYKRWCAHVGQMLELRYFDVQGLSDPASYKQEQKEGKAPAGVSRHLAAFHKWHNDERVASAWGEQGSLEDHRRYIDKVTNDPHVLPGMFSWDGELMGYIEIVYTKEDHSAVYFPFGDPTGEWDRGIHVLVGEEKFLGHGRAEIWLRALPHYIFLEDPRANRVVGEPNAANKAMVRVGDKSGFHFLLDFDFPYKRSALMVYSRDKFFSAHCHLY